MAESKHTPGPWDIMRTREEIWISAKTLSVCTIHTDEFRTVDEAEANAKVLAAGPEMLVALKQAEDFIFNKSGRVTRQSIEKLESTIQSALKKAE